MGSAKQRIGMGRALAVGAVCGLVFGIIAIAVEELSGFRLGSGVVGGVVGALSAVAVVAIAGRLREPEHPDPEAGGSSVER